MKHTLRNVITCCLLMLFVLPTPSAMSQTVEGEPGNWTWTRRFKESVGKASLIEVSEFNGNVRVVGTDDPSVTVVFKQVLNLPSAEQVREIASDTRIDVSTDGTVMSMEPSDRHRDVSIVEFELFIPRTIRLRIGTSSGSIWVEGMGSSVEIETNAGNVTVSDIGGDLQVRTGAGNVSVEHIVGNTVLNTAAGNVLATDVRADLETTSGGGGIELSEIKGTVSAITAGGAISVNTVMKDVVLFSSGGDIQAKDMAGGVSASTAGGQIEMRRVAGFAEMMSNGGHIQGSDLEAGVHAETKAGDITLDGITGPMHVLAEVGDIDIWIRDDRFPNGADAVIEAHYGDVNLSLPDTIDAELSVAIFNSGTIFLDENGGRIEILRERPSSRENQLRRADYRIGDGSGAISVITRSGDVKVRLN